METQERISSYADMEKQANGLATPPEITVGLENNNINEEGKFELDTEKGHIGEAGPRNKTGGPLQNYPPPFGALLYSVPSAWEFPSKSSNIEIL